jgi:predicted transcriptional regulator
MEKQANNKKFSAMFDNSTAVLNGFLEKEVNSVLKIMKKSDGYEDMMEDQKDYFEDHLEDMEDEYGKNFKYTYKIVDKDELEKDDLRDFRDELRSIADDIEWLEDEVDDFDSDDWEDMADELEISKGDAKDLVNEILDMGKVCKKAKVTAGYELTVEILLDGSELDEPEESEMTVYVYKVDGRWVAYEGLYALESFTYIY